MFSLGFHIEKVFSGDFSNLSISGFGRTRLKFFLEKPIVLTAMIFLSLKVGILFCLHPTHSKIKLGMWGSPTLIPCTVGSLGYAGTLWFTFHHLGDGRGETFLVDGRQFLQSWGWWVITTSHVITLLLNVSVLASCEDKMVGVRHGIVSKSFF